MSRQAQKKRQLRRTVSLSPRYFLLLESLGQHLDVPQSSVVENLLEELAQKLDVTPLSVTRARAEMLRRYHEGQKRKARRDARAYDYARNMAAEAFEQ